MCTYIYIYIHVCVYSMHVHFCASLKVDRASSTITILSYTLKLLYTIPLKSYIITGPI